MLRNYFKIAWRNLVKDRQFTFLNLIGLSAGLACSCLILLWVHNELSYDRFHEHSNNIYRVTSEVLSQKTAFSGSPLAATMKAEMREVKNTVRLKSNFGTETLFETEGRKFEEKNVLYADSTFFQIFSFPLIQGDSKAALMRPDGIILTERIAQKYFGQKNVIGKTIRMNDADDFTVIGVLQNIPANSHIQFDILLPMSFRARTDENIIKNNWQSLDSYTYVHLFSNVKISSASLVSMNKRIDEIYKKNDPDFFEAHFQLQPLTKIHLHSMGFIFFLFDSEKQGNIQYVRIFSIVAIFILLVACINFMNLATARSAARAKEVGVRKVIGASRPQLIGQFLGESILITFAALLLAVIFVIVSLPFFNDVLGKSLAIRPGDSWLLPGLLIIFLVTSLVSGSYPAFFLSAFHPIKVLKGGITKLGKGNIFFRNGLVVVQFVISIVLIVSTVVIYNQLRFIQNKNLGYDKENLLYLTLKGDLKRNSNTLRNELERRPELSNYSFVWELPIDQKMGTVGVQWKGKTQDELPMFSVMGVDENFLKVFKINLLAGREFLKSDTLNYAVNEKALQIMGFNAATAIGQPLTLWGNKGTIIGVVKDFNFKPAHQPVEPMIMRINSKCQYVVVRTKQGNIAGTIAELKKVSQKLNPSYDFEFGFVDQDLASLYKSEQRMSTFFNAFALLAIFISCLGLYGLIAFTAEQRTKEIGIRKVLGASVANIMTLLSKNFVKMLLLAILIATPLAWYGMSKWLETYAYRIDIEWWVFGIAGALALLIAICTISFQSVKAALMNPVKSLRTE